MTSSNGFSREAQNDLGIQRLRDELGRIWEECRQPGWDGEDAAAVAQETLRKGYVFLEALPVGAPPTSVGAEPDGALTFEWHRSRYRTLSVSIGAEEDLRFVALLGSNRVSGTEPFGNANENKIPTRVLDLIGEVSSQ
jgi:hypothetical protein